MTVFAPTDDAFAKLPEGTVESLLGDIPALSAILKRHVVPQPIFAEAISCKSTYATLQAGEELTARSHYSLRAKKLTRTVKAYTTSSAPNKAGVIDADLVATNGVIHAIDTVI